MWRRSKRLHPCTVLVVAAVAASLFTTALPWHPWRMVAVRAAAVAAVVAVCGQPTRHPSFHRDPSASREVVRRLPVRSLADTQNLPRAFAICLSLPASLGEGAAATEAEAPYPAHIRRRGACIHASEHCSGCCCESCSAAQHGAAADCNWNSGHLKSGTVVIEMLARAIAPTALHRIALSTRTVQ